MGITNSYKGICLLNDKKGVMSLIEMKISDKNAGDEQVVVAKRRDVWTTSLC